MPFMPDGEILASSKPIEIPVYHRDYTLPGEELARIQREAIERRRANLRRALRSPVTWKYLHWYKRRWASRYILWGQPSSRTGILQPEPDTSTPGLLTKNAHLEHQNRWSL